MWLLLLFAARASLQKQMVRSRAHVINVASITWRRMGITVLINRPHSWSYPAMRFRMGICKGDNPRSLSAVESARRGEKWLRIVGRNFKRRVADAARFGFDEDKELRRPAEGGIALVKEHGRDGSILLSPPFNLSINRKVPKLRTRLPAKGYKERSAGQLYTAGFFQYAAKAARFGSIKEPGSVNAV